MLAALALFALLLFGGNLFIWSFEVTGNETVPTETILRALEKCGVAVGSTFTSTVAVTMAYASVVP